MRADGAPRLCLNGARSSEQFLKNSVDFPLHRLSVRWLHVVVSVQMQNAVYQKVQDHFVVGIAQPSGIIRGHIRAYDHVAQEILLT